VTGVERIAVEAVVAILLIWGTVLYLEHRGAQQCYAADAAAVSKAETHNTVVETAGIKADVKAETHYDDTIAQPVAALPALPSSLSAAACPSAVRQTGGSAGQGDYRPTIRAPATTGVVSEGWDSFERSDVQSARDADAEVIFLQALLKSQHAVCTSTIVPPT
jgi:hypothetical protein